jgi:DnaJ family protein C protein 2
VYPAGPSYISYARRELLQRSFAEDDEAMSSARAAALAAKKANTEEVLYPGLGEEQEDKALLASDPKEWKKQDHYAILGLGHLRYHANDEQIRIARECG